MNYGYLSGSSGARSTPSQELLSIPMSAETAYLPDLGAHCDLLSENPNRLGAALKPIAARAWGLKTNKKNCVLPICDAVLKMVQDSTATEHATR